MLDDRRPRPRASTSPGAPEAARGPSPAADPIPGEPTAPSSALRPVGGRFGSRLSLAILAALPAACGAGADERPNVVLYVVDTLRADHLGCYGYERPTSPRIDQLASEGALFEEHYSVANWTQPSIGSLITSLPPLTFEFNTLLPERVNTMAEILREAGYRTAGFTTTSAVAPDFAFKPTHPGVWYLNVRNLIKF